MTWKPESNQNVVHKCLSENMFDLPLFFLKEPRYRTFKSRFRAVIQTAGSSNNWRSIKRFFDWGTISLLHKYVVSLYKNIYVCKRDTSIINTPHTTERRHKMHTYLPTGNTKDGRALNPFTLPCMQSREMCRGWKGARCTFAWKRRENANPFSFFPLLSPRHVIWRTQR